VAGGELGGGTLRRVTGAAATPSRTEGAGEGFSAALLAGAGCTIGTVCWLGEVARASPSLATTSRPPPVAATTPSSHAQMPMMMRVPTLPKIADAALSAGKAVLKKIEVPRPAALDRLAEAVENLRS
jgi:hypothetical protein